MSTQAAEDLSALLEKMDPEVAEPAIGPLQRLVSGSATSGNLVVALVGPSGTGKSALFNVLAGADIALVGALRPTTKEPEIWPIGSRGLVLIDTPPFELDPDAVCHALDRSDLALIVATPDRYADAIIRELSLQLERRGVPTYVALNRVPSDPALAAAITVDVIASLEGELTIVHESKAEVIDGSMLRDRMAGLGRTEIVAKRDRGAAIFIDDQIAVISHHIEDHDRLLEQVLDRAEHSFSDAKIDRARLAAAARLSWPLAAKSLLDTVSTTTALAMESVAKDPSIHPRFAAIARLAVDEAAPLNAAPLDAWKHEVSEAAVAQIANPAFHPFQRRAVRQHAWRLSADLAMVPDRRIRAALGDHVVDLRVAGNHSLTAALRDVSEDRVDRFMEAFGDLSPVSAADLREAAAALVVETGDRADATLSSDGDGADG